MDDGDGMFTMELQAEILQNLWIDQKVQFIES